MKKVVAFLCIALVMMSFSVFAAETVASRADNMASKFARGATNIATSPGEAVYQMPAAMEKSPDYVTGYVYSVFRGVAFTIRRFAVGVYDVVTFPFPGKTNYGPVIKPETIADQVLEPTV